MKNLVSIFAGHDASISFWNADTDKYHTIRADQHDIINIFRSQYQGQNFFFEILYFNHPGQS